MPPDGSHSSGLTTIWSRRFSIARGWHIKRERNCPPEEAEAWLRVFRGDEPEVAFAAARGRPPRDDKFRKMDAAGRDFDRHQVRRVVT